MTRAIVITSVFPPTEAVLAFSRMAGVELIVVGDKKTPSDWHCANVDYISVAQQEKLAFKLGKVLPYNHYCRKMVGYLRAMQTGCSYIIDTDDDNIPKDNWRFPEFDGDFECVDGGKGFVNIYQLYTKQKIWPRGLPLDLISTDFELDKYLSTKKCRVGVWQGLADEDPDVDAIYRLTDNTPCYFDDREPVVLGEGTICPFNTQNTIVRKELFPLLYLPTYVTFRFTDILRGIVAQPIMWLYGYRLGYTNGTVVQKRNPHDYLKDFMSEIPMYQQISDAFEIVSCAISESQTLESNLYNAYASLRTSAIVSDDEMGTLEAWLEDVSKLK